jgi:hypothetical protein
MSMTHCKEVLSTDNDDPDAPQTGRDRSKQNLIPGRKSLTGEQGKHSPVVNVRVTEQTREGLRKVAERRDVSLTKVAREALDGAQQYYVVWQQDFAGDLNWVRFDKPLTLEQAEEMFEQFKKTTARALNFRVMQIRRGRDNVVQEWRNQEIH